MPAAESRVLVVAVLAAFAGVYLFADARPVGTVAVGGLVAVQGWWLWRPVRWRVWVQVVLAYVAVIVGGASVGVLGLAAGVLNGWRGPVLVFGSAVAVEVRRGGDVLDPVITAGLIGLVVHGVLRLAARAREMAAARPALILAVAHEERLRIADSLTEALGRGLGEIETRGRAVLAAAPDGGGEAIAEAVDAARRTAAKAREVASGFRSLGLEPEMRTAEALLGSAGVRVRVAVGHREPLGPAGELLTEVLREAVTGIVFQGTARSCTIETSARDGSATLRIVHDGPRTAELGGLERAGRRLAEAGGTVRTGLEDDGRFAVEAAVRRTPAEVSAPDRSAYWFTVALLAVVMAGFCVKALLMIETHRPVAVVLLAAVAALQLQWRAPRRPRGWAWMLAAQAVLSYAPMIWFGDAWLGVPGFLAGALLVAFGRRPLPVVAVMASVAVIGTVRRLEPGEIVNYTLSTLVSALVVYALVRLAQLVKELQDAADELARAAVVQERLRAARDLHDVLGHTLAAIMLTCELARRLPPGQARPHLEEAVRMAARAQEDLTAVPRSLDVELESVRSVLAAADVKPVIESAHAGIDARTEAVFCVVVREAVTNVLRHSAATECRIRTGPAQLTVTNDGARPADRRPGAGLGNLTARLAELGGSLAVARQDDRFSLEARV